MIKTILSFNNNTVMYSEEELTADHCGNPQSPLKYVLA